MAKKKEKQNSVRCYDCKFAYLMRSTIHNPVVASCSVKETREIANLPRYCELFDHVDGTPIINEMIFIEK